MSEIQEMRDLRQMLQNLVDKETIEADLEDIYDQIKTLKLRAAIDNIMLEALK